MGSPPRVRGKARENGCFGAAEEDHPRVCGEKIIRGAHRLLNKGSPPRVRGKVILIVSISSSMRITPACAGKRTLADAKAASCRDHPRVCGEKSALLLLGVPSVGSPPRVRGKGVHLFPHRRPERITPACAGKRSAGALSMSSYWDHPRVCGEKIFTDWRMWVYLGSPPRVRGKESSRSAALKAGGITPACAGKRAWSRRPWPPHGDHPRVCGEKTKESLKK